MHLPSFLLAPKFAVAVRPILWFPAVGSGGVEHICAHFCTAQESTSATTLRDSKERKERRVGECIGTFYVASRELQLKKV